VTLKPEPDYNWSQGSNQSLLLETGDASNAWWWWFQPEARPLYGTSFILLNHSNELGNWSAILNGSAFNPNGAEPSSMVEFTYKTKLVSFSIYNEVWVVAPGSGSKVVVAAQNFGPEFKDGGIGLAGVRVFVTRNLYESWVRKVNP